MLPSGAGAAAAFLICAAAPLRSLPTPLTSSSSPAPAAASAVALTTRPLAVRAKATKSAIMVAAAAPSSTVREVDVTAYLDSIVSSLHREGPVLKKRISEPNRKPMIRTLLGYANASSNNNNGPDGDIGCGGKLEFDAAVRLARREMEYGRLERFVGDVLRPALLNLGIDDGDSNDGGGQDNVALVEDLTSTIDEALSRPKSEGAFAFRKLGTGRTYRGDALAMVRDLAGPEAAAAYVEAASELTEEEVMEYVIESSRGAVDEGRIEGALRCLHDFPGGGGGNGGISNDEDDSDDDDAVVGAADPFPSRTNGRRCERDCVAFLEGRPTEHGRRLHVLEKVYVNHLSASSRPKYNNRRSTSDSSSNGSNNNVINGSGSSRRGLTRSPSSSGIIWTSVSRTNLCSEFDAIVVGEEGEGTVTEFWEAKHSVSPSTLWDAVTKKMAAAGQLLKDDDEAMLEYRDGTTSKVIQLTLGPAGDESRPTFGIYGRELLPPENAVGQLKAMAVASTLGKDVDVVLRALDCGFVEVDRGRALRDIDILREELRKAADDFRITLVLGE